MNKQIRIRNRTDKKEIVPPPDIPIEYVTYNVFNEKREKHDVDVPHTVCPYCGEKELDIYDDCIHCASCDFFHMLVHKKHRSRFKVEYPELFHVYSQEKRKDKLVKHTVIYQETLFKNFGKFNEPSVEEIAALREADKTIDATVDDTPEEEPAQHTRPLHFEALAIGDFEFNEDEKLITSYITFNDEDIMFGISVKTQEVKEHLYAEFGTIEFYNREQVEKLLKKYSYEDLEYFIKAMWNFCYSIEYV